MSERETSDGSKDSKTLSQESYKKALGLVERNRSFFEHYARGKIHVKAAPPEMDTFASDLETGTMYVNGQFYKDHGHDLSDEKTSFAVLHELGHLEERIQLLSEEDGVAKFERHLARIKGSQAFSVMDNCVADIRENRTAIARTHEGFAHVEHDLYCHDLFPDPDFTKAH